jgi:hypothetical protein
MQHHIPLLFEKVPEKWEKLFAVENIQGIAEGDLVNRFSNWTNPCFV